jgi:carbonic anhydrase
LIISASDALRRLKDGNLRYSTDALEHAISTDARRKKLVASQDPFAVILGCADSRVPAELVFDQGLGDLFVIRVAGNIVAPSQIGSVEYAAEQFGVRLVVVLGHSSCGAVQATVDELQQPSENRSPNLFSIVNRISPAVESLLKTDLVNEPDKLMQKAVRSNIRISVNQLQHGSEILEDLIVNEGLQIVGAEYSLDTGEVGFLNDSD